ncbi:MAG TPA: DUF2442 domain-containing protein [Methylococcales bacterium]
MLLHVREASYVDGYRIRLRFNDGAQGVVDLSDCLDGEVFEPLKDIKNFKSFRVDADIETIVWDNGADMAPEFLYDRMAVIV